MKLLYGTTSDLVVTVSNRFYGSMFRLYFADEFNAVSNPPSSNPFRMFMDFSEMIQTNDIMNPKFEMHQRGVRRGIRAKLKGSPHLQPAEATIKRMGIQALQPYLAVLEADTYERHHGVKIQPTLPHQAGSPTSIEYLIDNIQGPDHNHPEMHLQRLH